MDVACRISRRRLAAGTKHPRGSTASTRSPTARSFDGREAPAPRRRGPPAVALWRRAARVGGSYSKPPCAPGFSLIISTFCRVAPGSGMYANPVLTTTCVTRVQFANAIEGNRRPRLDLICQMRCKTACHRRLMSMKGGLHANGLEAVKPPMSNDTGLLRKAAGLRAGCGVDHGKVRLRPALRLLQPSQGAPPRPERCGASLLRDVGRIGCAC